MDVAAVVVVVPNNEVLVLPPNTLLEVEDFARILVAVVTVGLGRATLGAVVALTKPETVPNPKVGTGVLPETVPNPIVGAGVALFWVREAVCCPKAGKNEEIVDGFAPIVPICFGSSGFISPNPKLVTTFGLGVDCVKSSFWTIDFLGTIGESGTTNRLDVFAVTFDWFLLTEMWETSRFSIRFFNLDALLLDSLR